VSHGGTGAGCGPALRRLLAVGLAGLAVAAVTACNNSKIAAVHRAPSRPLAHHESPSVAAKRQSVVARVDASSDAALAEGKVHIAEGAPSDAEVRREIKALRKEGITLPKGDTVESFANAQGAGSYAAGTERPEAPWNPRHKPIADWIVPVLVWAAEHGWSGTVTSGYRTYFEQAQLNAAGAFSAPAGASNHESVVYPGGAVDVTNSSQLINVLRGYPGPEKLVGGVLGPVDPEHFSATGD
jgi:hypothetical protein